MGNPEQLMAVFESALAGRAFHGRLPLLLLSPFSIPLSSSYIPVFTRTGRELSWLAGWTVAWVMDLLRGIAPDLEFPGVRSSGDDIMHILHCGSLSVHKCQLYAQETEEGK